VMSQFCANSVDVLRLDNEVELKAIHKQPGYVSN
jgi:hypothetical protein